MGVLFFVSGLGTPAQAQEFLVDHLTASVNFGMMKFFGWGVGAMTLIFEAIGRTLFQLAGFLITVGLQLNGSLMDNPVVLVGWVIARNLANLGIVFGLIVIAFATILRIDSWGAKKLLGDLIIVALLINFSLLIPGIFIDASGVVTNFFAQKVTGSDITKITEVIASASNIAMLQSASYKDVLGAIQKGDTAAAEGFSQGLINTILQMFFTALFTAYAAIVLMTVAYMLFQRFLALLMALIMAPLYSMSYIFPATKKYFSEWWGTIFSQSLALPVVMFFMYLAVLTAVGVEGGGKYDFISSITDTVASSASFKDSSFVNLFKQVAKMITILGLLSLGLIAGKKLGAEGASFGLGLISGVQKFALGALTGGATGLAMGAARGAGGVLGAPAWGARKYLASEVAPGVTRGQSWAAGLARFPGFRGIAEGLDKISSPDIKSSRAQYTNMSDSLLMATAKGTSMFRMNASEAVGVSQELASRKLLGKMSPDDLRTLAAKGGLAAGKEIYKVRPDFGTLADQKKYISSLSPKMIEEMEADLLLNSNINAGLGQKHIEAIASSNTEKQDKFLQGMENRLKSVDELGSRKADLNDTEAQWLQQDLDKDLENVFQNSVLQDRFGRLKLEKFNAKLAESKKSLPIAKQAAVEPPVAPPKKDITSEKSATPTPVASAEQPKNTQAPTPKENVPPKMSDKDRNISIARETLKKQEEILKELGEDISKNKLSPKAQEEAIKRRVEAENVVKNLKESLEKYS